MNLDEIRKRSDTLKISRPDHGEKVKCEDCGKEILKKDAIYDADAGEYICEEHLGENQTGYCSVSCQRTGSCDYSC